MRPRETSKRYMLQADGCLKPVDDGGEVIGAQLFRVEPTLERIVKKISALKVIGAAALGLLIAGAAGVQAWQGKADAAAVGELRVRVDAGEVRLKVVEELQRASYELGQDTRQMLARIFTEDFRRPAPALPAAAATPTPIPDVTPEVP